MKSFIQLILIIVFSQFTFSQHTLKGNISDKDTNEPLHDAYIYVVELNKGTSSNSSGDYFLSNLGKVNKKSSKFIYRINGNRTNYCNKRCLWFKQC